jgi:hypothetical protein
MPRKALAATRAALRSAARATGEARDTIKPGKREPQTSQTAGRTEHPRCDRIRAHFWHVMHFFKQRA